MPDQPYTTEAQLPPALQRASTSRRLLFQRAGLVALAGGGGLALAACNNTTPPAGTVTNSPTPAGATPESPAASVGPTATPASPSASGSASSPTASTVPSGTKVAKSDVPVGGGKVLPDSVVTQPTAGEFKAFTNICTHQGCPVASVQSGEIICDCHGSHFSITNGDAVSGPALTQGKGGLAAKTVTASGDNVYVSG